jgi:predicted transcriptional regulator
LATELELAEQELKKTRLNNKRPYRTRVQITYLILKHIKENKIENQISDKNFLSGNNVCGVTSIMYGLQTSSCQFKKYMEFVQKSGLITKEVFTRSKFRTAPKIYRYRITEKGIKFVEYIDKLMELVNEDNNDNKNNFLFPNFEDI